ncbi:hypothetical protein MIND_00562200 [Mycena indigotica]|uniref:Uncharacterized protein n=1 Tax=Mycena indigotica TaxID=2126181 RepID=A0A8H6SQT5_9AGAR|nr:uncharacterized protein MIND_00562200 [Mycena indigotica]KAF7303345.1 hypothetical protein MIND_00562200 [Mycena indigotica]
MGHLPPPLLHRPAPAYVPEPAMTCRPTFPAPALAPPSSSHRTLPFTMAAQHQHPLKFNLTIDDFDSLITYPNQSHWATPDPSAGPNATLAGWFDETYHRTNITGAVFEFKFKGSEFFIFGAAGPKYGAYEVDIDASKHVRSAHALRNIGQYLLFHQRGLEYKEHLVKVTNLGRRPKWDGTDLLVDFVKTTVDVAPAGKRMRALFTPEIGPRTCTTRCSRAGTPRYTNGDGASVSLTFNATAIFIFGDKTDRHGLYSVSLDGGPPTLYNGVSGCGGAFAHACEKDNTLAYFAANLDDREHTVTVTNIPGELGAYFDLDAIVLTSASVNKPMHSFEMRESNGTQVQLTANIFCIFVLWLILFVLRPSICA